MTIGNMTFNPYNLVNATWHNWQNTKEVIGQTVLDYAPSKQNLKETILAIHNSAPVVILKQHPVAATITAGAVAGSIGSKFPFAASVIIAVSAALIQTKETIPIFALSILGGYLTTSDQAMNFYSQCYGKVKAIFCPYNNNQDSEIEEFLDYRTSQG